MGSIQHRFGASGAEGKNISFLYAIRQQSRLRISIEQQNNNLNFLFVYWADVPAESYKLPSHRQCVDVRGNTSRLHFMIKSKFSYTGIFLLWFMTLIVLLMLYLAFGALLHFFEIEIVKTTLTNFQFIIVLLAYPLLIFIAFSQIKINSSIIYINSSDNTVTSRTTLQDISGFIY